MSSSNGPTPPPQCPSLDEIQKSWFPVDYERGWFQERTPLRWPPRSQRRKPALLRRVQAQVRAPEAAPISHSIVSDLLNATVVASAMLKPFRLVVELTTQEAFDEALQYFKGSAAEDHAAKDVSELAASTQEQVGASDGENDGPGATSDLESFLQQSDREDRVRKRANAAVCKRKKRKKALRSRAASTK